MKLAQANGSRRKESAGEREEKIRSGFLFFSSESDYESQWERGDMLSIVCTA